MAGIERISSLLRCADCRAAELEVSSERALCRACGRVYEVTDEGILVMMPADPLPLPPMYDDPDYRKYRALYEERDPLEVYYSEQSGVMHTIRHSSHRHAHEFFTAAHADGWVLDLGCGTGDHFPYFADRSRVVGLDISLGSLRAALKRYPDVALVQGDATALPFQDASFGSIFSIHSFEHLWYLDEALMEAHRVLRRGGHLFMGLPAEGGLLWELGRRVSTQRVYTKKYGIDYGKVARIEHCNTATKVIEHARKYFRIAHKRYWPVPIPILSCNLTVALDLVKEADLPR